MPTKILKSAHEIALLLTLKPGSSPAARKVSARVLARIELAMAEAEFAAELREAATHC